MTRSHNPIEKAGHFQVYPPFANTPLFVLESAFSEMSEVGYSRPEEVVIRLEYDTESPHPNGHNLRMVVESGSSRTYLVPDERNILESIYPSPVEYFSALASLFRFARENGKSSRLLDELYDLPTRLGDLNE